MLAVVAPGQGAQTPGMLAPWVDVPASAALLHRAEAATGLDLVRLGTRGSAEQIRDTAIAQPLLVATALAAAAALDLVPQEPGAPLPSSGDRLGATAGHSVGELAGLVLAGALGVEQAMQLAVVRGRAMAEACRAEATGMTAVLGGDPDEVDTALSRAGLVAANRNAPGQVVAAGPVAGLDALAADPPSRARLRRLEVAGAFHTAAMLPARAELEAFVSTLPAGSTADARVPVVANADGAVVTSGHELLTRLVAQVAAPVRWDLCTATLAGLGVTALVELPPAGTLAGLAKRALPGVEILALRTPDDLDAARALLHASPPAAPEPGMAFRIAVSPGVGAFVPGPVGEGDTVAAGAALGQVRGRQEQHDVRLAASGVLVEWLAAEGDPVTTGQPLARLA